MLLYVVSLLVVDTTPFLLTPASSVSRSPALRQAVYNDMEDLEKARSSFEALMKQHGSALAPDQSTSTIPVLTSASRHRKRLEIDLLESLADSDDAIEELVHLWMHENTADDAMVLTAMETQCSDGLIEEEKTLRSMVLENPHWVEPRVRLALLLFYKGQTEQSYQVAIEALRLKPWHFEICHVFVLLSLRQQDMGQALYWARRGLPSLYGKTDSDSVSRRRKGWVQRALQAAHAKLEEAEVATEELRAKQAQPETSSEVWQ